MRFKRIAIDTSKHVFTLHGVDEQERPVLRRELKRGQVESFFAKQEATGYWQVVEVTDALGRAA
jgi:transposase